MYMMFFHCPCASVSANLDPKYYHSFVISGYEIADEFAMQVIDERNPEFEI